MVQFICSRAHASQVAMAWLPANLPTRMEEGEDEEEDEEE
jgi:hypothetical protein